MRKPFHDEQIEDRAVTGGQQLDHAGKFPCIHVQVWIFGHIGARMRRNFAGDLGHFAVIFAKLLQYCVQSDPSDPGARRALGLVLGKVSKDCKEAFLQEILGLHFIFGVPETQAKQGSLVPFVQGLLGL